MALGETEEAKNNLLRSVYYNNQEEEAYHALSMMLETTDDAEKLIENIEQVNTECLAPHRNLFIDFALSNCFHKIKKFDISAEYLKRANDKKLLGSPSNAKKIEQAITLSLSHSVQAEQLIIEKDRGKERIFIVGMPRSGSTLLETMLSMNPRIKDLGESNSLTKAIAKTQNPNGIYLPQELYEAYSEIEPIDRAKYTYSTDKQLYNFIYIDFIVNCMPGAKIIHCRRNPMYNILSMYRSNLSSKNSFTADIEDAAKVLIAQERVMKTQKNRYSKNIYTFDYDRFVNSPDANLRNLLGWLNLEFNDFYLQPEKSTRSVNTASVMQARKPIRNESVGVWKKYSGLLNPALNILRQSELQVDLI